MNNIKVILDKDKIEHISKEYTKEYFKDIVNKITDRAVNLCPIDTGKLKDSIKNDIEDTKAIISANTDYAVYVEMGTIKQDAQSYLRASL